MKKLIVMMCACAAFVAVADVDDGVEPVEAEPFTITPSTFWGSVPADANLADTVNAVVEAVPSDYDTVRANAAAGAAGAAELPEIENRLEAVEEEAGKATDVNLTDTNDVKWVLGVNTDGTLYTIVKEEE